MSSPAVLIEIQRCQRVIVSTLAREGQPFSGLFDACGLDEGGRVSGQSHMRILDRALQGLRRHGEIRFDRRSGTWVLGSRDTGGR